MQKRRAIGVEILLNKQESSPTIFLNASDSEDAVVDEVFSVGFYLFFVALGVWPGGMKSCIFFVEHKYEKATARSSQFRSTKGIGEHREGRKTSGVADEIMAVRVTERRKRWSGDLLKDSKF
jgi:hypothetical protein